MQTWITICDTCKRDGWDQGDMSLTDGQRLAELIEAADPVEGVRTRRISCMMGCKHGCNVAIQGKGKLAYTLGNFEPHPEAAKAIISYAKLHFESGTGQVPYREWPTPVKGHFITRHQPLPEGE